MAIRVSGFGDAGDTVLFYGDGVSMNDLARDHAKARRLYISIHIGQGRGYSAAQTLGAVFVMNQFIALIFCTLLAVGSAFADPAVQTFASVYKDKAALAGKESSVQGKVAKVKNGIMWRNFVHVLDGSGVLATPWILESTRFQQLLGNYANEEQRSDPYCVGEPV